MASRLAHLVVFENQHHLNFNTATVDLHCYQGLSHKEERAKLLGVSVLDCSDYLISVNFHHSQESPESYRAFKKAVGPLTEDKNVNGLLRSRPFSLTIGESPQRVMLLFSWIGGFECTTTTKCKWKGFPGEDDEEQ